MSCGGGGKNSKRMDKIKEENRFETKTKIKGGTC
jgi:hypothetical protein